MWDDQADDRFLILKKLLDFVDCIQPLGLSFNILGFILVVVVLLADEKLLLETLLRVFVRGTSTGSISWLGTARSRAGLARSGSAR